MRGGLALYPGTSDTALVTCSTNREEGLEEWHIPGKSKEVIMLLIATTTQGVTEWSTLDSLGAVSWVQKAAPQLYMPRATPPDIHLASTCRNVTV